MLITYYNTLLQLVKVKIFERRKLMKKKLSPWGQQCKLQMLVLGKSLSDISCDTKYSRNYISAIINGRIVVPDETAEAISKSLCVDTRLPRHV